MRMIPTTTVHVRGILLALLGAAVFLVSACEDSGAPPMGISNTTEETVSLRFSEPNQSIFGNETTVLLFREVGTREFHDAYSLLPGAEIEIEFERVLARRTYPLIVGNASGEELFKRTFLLEELDDRDWRITITPEGIR